MDEHLGFAFEGFSALLPPYMRDNGSKTNECEGMNPHQVLGYILACLLKPKQYTTN